MKSENITFIVGVCSGYTAYKASRNVLKLLCGDKNPVVKIGAIGCSFLTALYAGVYVNDILDHIIKRAKEFPKKEKSAYEGSKEEAERAATACTY